MAEKRKGNQEQITFYLQGKRTERSSDSSDSSSPGLEKPPAKSVRFSETNMAELEEIWKALKTIKSNTDQLLEDNKALHSQYSELQKSLEFHVAKIEVLTTENIQLKKEVKSLKKSLNEATDEQECIAGDLETAINQIDDLEQYTRKHNLEIHGITEQPRENITQQIVDLGTVLNVAIREDDIDICHRLQVRNDASKPRPIIVRFKSYKAKKELYAARKHLRNQTFNGEIVYINENLTRMRRELFASAWRRKKTEHWHSVWTIDGKIFVKVDAADSPFRIYSKNDLDVI